MALISELTVSLRGTTGNLDAALDRGSKKVGDFGARVGRQGKGVQDGLGRALSGLGSQLGGLLGPIGSLTGPLSSLTGSLGGLTGSLGGVGLSLGGLAAGFAGLAVAVAAAAAALVGFGFASMSSIDRQAKLADRLGISMESLAGLEHGANIAGLGAEALEANMRHLTRTLAEAGQASGHTTGALVVGLGMAQKAGHGAAEGAGHAGAAFVRLGLSAGQLTDMRADQQLEALADAFQKVPNAGDRAALAMQIFGREGSQMVTLLQGGSKGLQAFKAEAQALGLAVSRDQARQVEEANRAWIRMKGALQGVGNSMAVFISPAVSKLAAGVQYLFQGINSGITGAMPYLRAIWDTVQSFFAMIGEMLQPVVDLVKAGFASLSETLAGWGITWDNVKNLFLTGLWATQFEYKHWRDYLALGLDTLILGFVSFGQSLKYEFTELLPQVFVSFGTFLGTWFSNLWENIKNNFDQLWEYLKTGGTSGGDFSWKPLTEGWDKAMEEIARKAHRPLTDYEKELIDRIKKRQGDLTKGLGEFLRDKFAEFNKPAKGEETPEKGKAGMAATKRPAAVEAGSLEAFKIISGDQKDKMWALGNDQLKEARKHNKLLDRVLNRLRPIPIGHARL